MNPEILHEQFRERGIRRIKLGAFDIDCTLRGKYISLDKFWSAVESGLGFCDVVFGWDIADALYDNVKFTGWHTGYPDAACRIDLQTFRTIPWEPGTAFFLMDFQTAAGQPLPIAPRQVFQRVLSRAAEMGFLVFSSAEYEFFFFRENTHSLREKRYANLTPLTPGMFGYSILRASANAPLVLDLLDQLAGFGVPLEGFHTETGPGVYEAAIAAVEGLEAADRAALFKIAVKEIAARHNCVPTFMAKWNADLPGSSGHMHQSVWDRERQRNLFCEGSIELAPTMRHYIAGLIQNLPDLAAMVCPTINSYKRTVPGTWAPINASWGIDNRTTAVRAIPGRKKSARIELRLAGADINPYLAMSASVAAGLDGVARKSEPPEPSVNAYAQGGGPLPRTLAEATSRLR